MRKRSWTARSFPTFSCSSPGWMPTDSCWAWAASTPTRWKTLPDQLEAAGHTWKGYMEDMGKDPRAGERATCGHPAIGKPDETLIATATEQVRGPKHNPFVYFHTIIDDPGPLR